MCIFWYLTSLVVALKSDSLHCSGGTPTSALALLCELRYSAAWFEIDVEVLSVDSISNSVISCRAIRVYVGRCDHVKLFIEPDRDSLNLILSTMHISQHFDFRFISIDIHYIT